MEKQPRLVSKEEAHRLIDESPGDSVLILTYKSRIGVSDTGKHIKKKRSKKYVDRSASLVLVDGKPIQCLNLHNKNMKDLSEYGRENIVKSIMLAKLE